MSSSADLLRRGLQIRRGEWAAVALSFAYFFLLLASYYMLRPIRDALAAANIGAQDLRFAFLTIFLVMLVLTPVFGMLAARLTRRRLIPLIYLFFLANIVLFYWLFGAFSNTAALAYVFFVWLSVFNLFVVSVFWSFMADLYDSERAQRLFGPIAAGGSLGAILGPLLTRHLAESLGLPPLMLIAATLLGGALACMLALDRTWKGTGDGPSRPMGGGALEGAKLAFSNSFLRGMTLLMVLGTLSGSMLYLLQIDVVGKLREDPAQLTAFFAGVDLSINVLSVLIQLTLTGRVLAWLGFPATLALLPLIALLGFGLIAAHPSVWVIVGLQVARRTTLFAIANPVSQMLFTALGVHSKYKFKNFLDTVVYRAGDTLGSWLFAGLIAAGGIGLVAATGCLVAAAMVAVAIWIGRAYLRLGREIAVPD
ncbi:MAG: MFS transporter [Xanthomonadales bacterium]|nr:MFS transporter [Xanthomonadales bacterium]